MAIGDDLAVGDFNDAIDVLGAFMSWVTSTMGDTRNPVSAGLDGLNPKNPRCYSCTDNQILAIARKPLIWWGRKIAPRVRALAWSPFRPNWCRFCCQHRCRPEYFRVTESAAAPAKAESRYRSRRKTAL
jgi:hypothetical protein